MVSVRTLNTTEREKILGKDFFPCSKRYLGQRERGLRAEGGGQSRGGGERVGNGDICNSINNNSKFKNKDI